MVCCGSVRSNKPLVSERALGKATQEVRFELADAVKLGKSDGESKPPSASPESNKNV